MLLLQALKPFNSLRPFPTFYSQNLNSGISHFPQRQQQMLLSLCSPSAKSKKFMSLSTFSFMGSKKDQIICLPLSFPCMLKAQHTNNPLHRSFQDSGFPSPTYIQDDVPFLAGNLQSGYTRKDNLEKGHLKTNLYSVIIKVSFYFYLLYPAYFVVVLLAFSNQGADTLNFCSFLSLKIKIK